MIDDRIDRVLNDHAGLPADPATPLPVPEWARYGLSVADLAWAVARVHATMTAHDSAPDAAKWVTHAAYFRELRNSVVHMWALGTRLDPARFPFADDFVRWAWAEYAGKGEVYEWARQPQPQP